MPPFKCSLFIRWYRTSSPFPIVPIDGNTPPPISELCDKTRFDFVVAVVVALAKDRPKEPRNGHVHVPANGLFRIGVDSNTVECSGALRADLHDHLSQKFKLRLQRR
jgi:hypothetical protein